MGDDGEAPPPRGFARGRIGFESDGTHGRGEVAAGVHARKVAVWALQFIQAKYRRIFGMNRI
jgi:hypothetical protein